MSRKVRVKAGKKGIALPDGNVYDGQVDVVLTDAQFAELRSSAFVNVLEDLGDVADPGAGPKITAGVVAPAAPNPGDIWVVPNVGPQAGVLALPWTSRFFASEITVPNGSLVPTWKNNGSDLLDATVPTGGADTAPVFRQAAPIFNYREAVQFVASQLTVLKTAAWTARSQPGTIVCVGQINSDGQYLLDGFSTSYYRQLARSGGKWLIRAGSATAPTSASGTGNALPHLFIIEFNTTTSTLEVDGTQLINADAGAQQTRGLTMGAQSGLAGRADGYIAFCSIINRLLTPQEKTDIRTWVHLYYGLTIAGV